MLTDHTSLLNLPRKRRRYRFSMTALADMMFQLLVFFMLSANVLPYALLTVRAGGIENAAGGDDAKRTATLTKAAATAVWTIDRAGITASGQHFDLTRTSDLVKALAAQKTSNVLLVIRPDVDIQTIVGILEQLAANGISGAQIADGGRG